MTPLTRIQAGTLASIIDAGGLSKATRVTPRLRRSACPNGERELVAAGLLRWKRRQGDAGPSYWATDAGVVALAAHRAREMVR